MKYRIIERYQHWTREGIQWSKWFPCMLKPETDTKEELKDVLKKTKEDGREITKHTKLKYEFDIEEFDDTKKPKYDKTPALEQMAKASRKNKKTTTKKKKATNRVTKKAGS